MKKKIITIAMAAVLGLGIAGCSNIADAQARRVDDDTAVHEKDRSRTENGEEIQSLDENGEARTERGRGDSETTGERPVLPNENADGQGGRDIVSGIYDANGSIDGIGGHRHDHRETADFDGTMPDFDGAADGQTPSRPGRNSTDITDGAIPEVDGQTPARPGRNSADITDGTTDGQAIDGTSRQKRPADSAIQDGTATDGTLPELPGGSDGNGSDSSKNSTGARGSRPDAVSGATTQAQ